MTRYLAPLIGEEKVSVKVCLVCHRYDLIHKKWVSQADEEALGLLLPEDFLIST